MRSCTGSGMVISWVRAMVSSSFLRKGTPKLLESHAPSHNLCCLYELLVIFSERRAGWVEVALEINGNRTEVGIDGCDRQETITRPTSKMVENCTNAALDLHAKSDCEYIQSI